MKEELNIPLHSTVPARADAAKRGSAARKAFMILTDVRVQEKQDEQVRTAATTYSSSYIVWKFRSTLGRTKAGPTLFVGKFMQKPYCTIDCIGFISLALHQLDADCVCSSCGRHSEMHLWSRLCSASRYGISSA